MLVMFYHKFGSIIAKTTCRIIKAFLPHGHLLKELNDTHITLIAKKGNPKKSMIISLLVFIMSLLILYEKIRQIVYVHLIFPFAKCLYSSGNILRISLLRMQFCLLSITKEKIRLYGR